MQISRIKWLNIMGLENLTIEPGKLTVVKGPNAAGKSSMAAGIASILDGGAHEAKLLRNGATEGQIVFELEDGSSIEKRIREDGSDIKVRNEKGKVVAKPATVVQSLLNKASANPIAFFTAEKEDRKKILLKAMPIKADPERIKAITDLADYRIELMQSLPIPGLEVKGDDIYYHGVVWEGLNEAKRMELAFEIALLQCGEVPFLFVDGAERLDGKNFEIFKERVHTSKAQCIMFAVDHDPEATGLTIEEVQ